MFDIERFQVLVRGDDVPQNDEEQSWIDNFNRNSKNSLKESLDNRNDYHNRKIQASKELYLLLKDSFPDDFFCQKPYSVDEVEKVEDVCYEKAQAKYAKILKNPLLRIQYGVKISHVMPEEYNYHKIVPLLFNDLFSKHYNVDMDEMICLYKKYATLEFLQKAENIETKYDVKLDYHNFNLFKWLTDYYEFKECAKYYGWK